MCTYVYSCVYGICAFCAGQWDGVPGVPAGMILSGSLGTDTKMTAMARAKAKARGRARARGTAVKVCYPPRCSAIFLGNVVVNISDDANSPNHFHMNSPWTD